MTDGAPSWPVMPGSYVVGDPSSPVAVCTLTSEKLMGPLAKVAGVAISGMVYTANLGITRIVVNITANPAIRFLLICGRESPLFKPGQSLTALSDSGIDAQRRIIGASGYEPVLHTVPAEQVEQFRKQVEVVDWTGEEDLDKIQERISDLAARNPGRFAGGKTITATPDAEEKFVTIRPGGQREPLIYDPKGYFVISLDRGNGEIVLRHYSTDHKPAHEMRGRGATSMLLGLLRDGLVTQLSHAGYLGEELSKAQTALQFGLRYDQDRPLRQQDAPGSSEAGQSAGTKMEGGGSVSATKEAPKPPPEPMTLTQLEGAGLGSQVDFGYSVTEMSAEGVLGGVFLKMDEAQPFSAYHRTDHDVAIKWNQSTKFIMGQASDLVVGALVRIVGKKQDNHNVTAEGIIVLTRVAKIISQRSQD